MQWGYPRTVEGFFHALSRGQYETVHGTNILQDPVRFIHQLWYIVQGLSESFNWVFMFIGLLPFLFLLKMHKRERSWIVGLSSIYFCIVGAAGDFAGRGPGPFVGGFEQGVLHRVARAVRHHDRLRADVDGGLHGDALHPIPILGIFGRVGRR